jgi:hypothetical protein
MPPKPSDYPHLPEYHPTCACEMCQEANTFHDPGPLEDCYWLWRQRLSLTEIPDMVERLAQEASLFLITQS